MRKHLVTLFIVALCLATVSCRKLEGANKPAGPLTYEAAKFADAIPQEYGQLIAVNQNPTEPSWVALWFQKPDGTITIVSVNAQDGKLANMVVKIPRR